MAVTLDPSLVARLHRQANGARWGVSVREFEEVLEASVTSALGDKPAARDEVNRYLLALHLEDLALARACAAGQEHAWEHFVREHRPSLYRAADAIDPTGGARDLADSLYGDLFGLDERRGTRQSLFRYFHGRSRLSTWLRAVLSQRHVDRVRAERRLDPLPDDDAPGVVLARHDVPDPERPPLLAAVQAALAAAVTALAPRDRLRLGCYYVQHLTLAAIGRMLEEHEATVSRHLARARAAVRDGVEQRLRTEHGLDNAAIAKCFELIVEDPGTLDLADLVAVAAERKNQP